jgi:DegV family protein with EDD domain
LSEVAVITDSLSCLPQDKLRKHGIGLVPINIIVNNHTYRDSIDLTPEKAYELFQKDPESFSTSPALPIQYLEAMREASRTARNILCITVSKHLSTGYNVARLAGEQAEREIPGLKIRVMDSTTVLASQGLIVLAAALKARSGENMDQVVAEAEKIQAKVTFSLVLETIRNVYRTGRIPKIAAQAASVLPIKPILAISSGVVKLTGMSQNMTQGINRILKTLKSKVSSSPIHVVVMHAYVPDEAARLQQRIASEFNCIEIWTTEVSPIVGYALGAGALGFAYYKDGD